MRRLLLLLVPLLAAGLSLPSSAAVPAGSASLPVSAAGPSPYEGFVTEATYVPTPYGDIRVELHRPAHGKMPVIVQMTPYRYLYQRVRAAGVPTSFYSKRYAPKGYAIAFADVLGTGESSGCWDYGGAAEAGAGAAVIEWLGTRPWSTGKVGMIGTSYDGAIQTEIATLAPKHLAAIVPQEPVTSWYGYNYDHAVTHNSTDDDVSPGDTGYPVGTPDLFDAVLGRTPNTDEGRSGQQHAANLADKTSECELLAHEYRGHLVNPSYGAFWKERDWALRASKVKAAVLMQHGWRDFNTKPDQFTRFWLNLSGAKDKRAIVGQWNHTDIFAAPPKGVPVDVRSYLDNFFARYLLGQQVPALDLIPKVLSQGFDKTWRTSLPLTTPPTTLAFSAPKTFVNSGVQSSKVFKNVPVGADPATATWIGPVLKKAQRLTGGGTVTADVVVDGVRGQLNATALDLAPDGTLRVVTLGLLDLRYSGSLGAPASLVPGQVVRATVTLRPQDAVFAAGHRIVLVLAGSEAVWGVPDVVAGQSYALSKVTLRLPLVDL